MNNWNDKSLFDALRRGNSEGLSVPFRRHYDYLIHYGVQIGADRIMVEGWDVFLYLFESYERFMEVNKDKVKAYSFKSLRNRILAAHSKLYLPRNVDYIFGLLLNPSMISESEISKPE